MGIQQQIMDKTLQNSISSIKPFLESLHARLELMNVQLARIEAYLSEPYGVQKRNAIDQRAGQAIKELEKKFE